MNDMFYPKSEFMGLISVSNRVLIFYSPFSLSGTQQPQASSPDSDRCSCCHLQVKGEIERTVVG